MSHAPIYKVVASDMDGTLLNNHNLISEVTKATLLRLAVEKNVQFVFATGRHHLTVRNCADALRAYFDANYVAAAQRFHGNTFTDAVPGFYIVSSNGARIHDPAGKLLAAHSLDPDVVRHLYNKYAVRFTSKVYAGPAGATTTVPEDTVATFVYTTNEWFMSTSFRKDEEILQKFGMAPQILPFNRHDPANVGKSVFDQFPVEDIGKLCFSSPTRNALIKLEEELQAEFGDRLSIAFSSDYSLDVMCGGVSKGAALQQIVEHISTCTPTTSLTMANVVAFGDSMNDQEMLAMAGLGCIMENGQPRLKQSLLNHPTAGTVVVIGTNEENGVAKKLEEVYQLSAQ